MPPWRFPSRTGVTCSRPARSPSRARPRSSPTALTSAAPTSVNRRPGLGAWIVLAFVLLAAAAVRLRLLEAPLDRDEGEYAYFGQLLLQGIPPYATAYHAKLPGVYGAYAEHFLLLPALAGVLVLMRAVESRRLLIFFAGGVLVGLAFIVKQSGGAFVLFAALYALLAPGPAAERSDWGRRSVLALAVVAGALVPFAVVCAGFAAVGLFDRFWFWTVVYTSHYASPTPPSVGLLLLTLTARSILSSSFLVVVPAVVGVSALIWDPRAHAARLFVLLLSVCALAGASVGLYFRNQYFLLLTPAAALLAGLGAEALATRVSWAPALRYAL